MTERADRVPSSWGALPTWIRRHRPPEQSLFSGIYGLVLVSALAAALDPADEKADPGPDALWILVTAAASAVAHGYAHTIARRASAAEGDSSHGFGSLVAEWPVVAAAVPTMALLLGAFAGWWGETNAVNAALAFNTVMLFCWGALTARGAGYSRAAACRAGGLDMLIGFLIIGVNALIK
jgi:hypothetical protein